MWLMATVVRLDNIPVITGKEVLLDGDLRSGSQFLLPLH